MNDVENLMNLIYISLNITNTNLKLSDFIRFFSQNSIAERERESERERHYVVSLSLFKSIL